MKLMELFSQNPDSEQRQEEDIDWLDDLKFYIDNNDDVLAQFILPAINKHKQHQGHPSAYKLYVEPLTKCAEAYCKKFETEHPANELFSKDAIIELARNLADSQDGFIEKGDYE